MSFIYSCSMYTWSINGYDIILLLYEISFSIWYDILFIWYIIFDKIWYFSIRYDIFPRNFQDFSRTNFVFLDMSSFANFCTHLCLFYNDLDSENPPPTLIMWISQIHFWFRDQTVCSKCCLELTIIVFQRQRNISKTVISILRDFFTKLPPRF